MGCAQSLPATIQHDGAASGLGKPHPSLTGGPLGGAHAHAGHAQQRGLGPAASAPGAQLMHAGKRGLAAGAPAADDDPDVLSPTEILDTAAAALAAAPPGDAARLAAAPAASAAALCALALCETSGDRLARHRGPGRYGLWALTLPTARWLASKEGWGRFPSPTAASLEEPSTAAYFAAALLATTGSHGGRPRGERFAVLAFHAGPDAAAAACRAARRGGAAAGGGDAAWDGDDADSADGWSDDEGLTDGAGVWGWGDGAGCDWHEHGCDGDGGAGGCDQHHRRSSAACGPAPAGGPAAAAAAPPPAGLRPEWDLGELLGFWRRYERAKGLVLQLCRALDLRRRAEAARRGGKDGAACWAAGGSGGDDGWGQGCTIMHLVRQGETLRRIAAITGTSVSDLLAANPDLPGEGDLQPNDLITLPVPAVVPRLHALRPGDSLRGIGRRYGISLGRLLARNPELADPRQLAPGFVVLIPGLRGDSEPSSGSSGGGAAAAGGAGGGGGGGWGAFGGGHGGGGGGGGTFGAAQLHSYGALPLSQLQALANSGGGGAGGWAARSGGGGARGGGDWGGGGLGAARSWPAGPSAPLTWTPLGRSPPLLHGAMRGAPARGGAGAGSHGGAHGGAHGGSHGGAHGGGPRWAGHDDAMLPPYSVL